jgi:UDP-N-acetylmuramoylalanine--D-glutamate ligase
MNAMSLNNASNATTVIVGLGTTGLSVARFLQQQQREFAVMDSRDNPPNAEDLKQGFPNAPYHFGSFNSEWLNQAEQIIVNPGIAIATPEITDAKQAGAEIVGDIELFAREVKNTQPIIAITGSNGKTTVTMLLDLMAKKSGFNVGTGGNIGTAALDLLAQENTDLYVLELSSFQLETTTSLQTISAVILNVSEDHLDRYDNNLELYAQAKGVIYNNCQHVVYNRDDAYSTRLAKQSTGYKSITSFGLDAPEAGQFGVKSENGINYLAKGNQLLMPVSEVKLPGLHNQANALACLALGEFAGLKMTAMLDVLREYAGMEHRTQWLANIEGVNWYNDSKGTNVGATLAALTGLTGKTVLIAGGQGKGADFSPLSSAIKEHAKAVILMGEDAQKIAAVIDDSISVVFVSSMQAAVKEAYKLAQKESDNTMNVLLSPACASFDMFKNYIVRGEMFSDAVNELKTMTEQKGAANA